MKVDIMRKPLNILLPSTLLLVMACSGGDGEFAAGNGDNHLIFDGRQIEIDSVYCSDRMRRVTVRFEQGALYVSERDEAPGYEAVLRITSPERSEYVNRKIVSGSSDPISTDGLNVDPDRGINGDIQLMRSMVLLNPDRFPDAVARELEVRAACPN